MPQNIRSLVTPDGHVVRVPGTGRWTVAARRTILFNALSDAVGTPVRPTPSGVPRPGNLCRILGRPDVLIRASGGTDDREHRTALHITREHHEVLVAHMADGGYAFQTCVAAVSRRPGRPIAGTRPLLALAAFSYDLLASVVSDVFAARPALRRLNLTLAARRDPGGLSLTIPEYRVRIASGVEELSRVLEARPGTAAATLLDTPQRVAVVAAVLELQRGLRVTVCPNDAGSGIEQRMVQTVGLQEVTPHRLEQFGAPCARSAVNQLSRTDLLAAPSADLAAHPNQRLTLVEVEKATTNGVEKLGRRYRAAAELGLSVDAGILIVRDEKVDWFRNCLASAPVAVQALTTVEPMSAWYADYCRLRDAHTRRQRDRVRRAAA